jgi:hypothetical protein
MILAMDARQRTIIWVATLMVVGMGLFPPWVCTGTRGVSAATGYHWIFSSPRSECLVSGVDGQRLLIQWAMIVVLTCALYVAWPASNLAGRPVRIVKASIRVALPAIALLILIAGGFALVYSFWEFHSSTSSVP